jgi:hypothetical protein
MNFSATLACPGVRLSDVPSLGIDDHGREKARATQKKLRCVMAISSREVCVFCVFSVRQ